MEHVVFFPAPDGSPAFRRVASIDEAVRLVEHLRNVEGVSSVSVHALTEVPLAFRAYYRVEVPVESVVPAQQQPVDVFEPVAVEVESQPEPVAVEPVPAVEGPALALVEDVPSDEQEPEDQEQVLVSSNGQTPATPASLGFFA